MQHQYHIQAATFRPNRSRMVGQPEVMARIGSAEITSGLPVIREESIRNHCVI
jgi:hypothetical protein